MQPLFIFFFQDIFIIPEASGGAVTSLKGGHGGAGGRGRPLLLAKVTGKEDEGTHYISLEVKKEEEEGEEERSIEHIVEKLLLYV